MNENQRPRWFQFGLGTLFVIVLVAGVSLAWLLKWNESAKQPVQRRLSFPGNVALMTVRQRSSQPLPGSNGQWVVRLDDITRGQVLLTVEHADGTRLVNPQSVQQGDRIPLPWKDEHYVLHVKKLVNVLIGQDWAEIEVRRISPEQQK